MHSFRQSINMIYFSFCKTSDKMLISHARLLLTFTMPLCTLFYYSVVFFSSLRTVEKIEREKALSHSTILGRNASVEWVYLSWCTRITWMSHPHVAPSHSEASLDWEMTVAHWTVGVGLPLSWVCRALLNPFYFFMLCFF